MTSLIRQYLEAVCTFEFWAGGLAFVMLLGVCRSIIEMIKNSEYREALCTFRFCNCYWKPIVRISRIADKMGYYRDNARMPFCYLWNGYIYDIRELK